MRVVTINTGRNWGDYVPRIARLAERIAELAPDVVLAQEVLASEDGRHDTADVLAARLGFHVAAAPARQKPRTIAGVPVMSTSGLAVLSRYPIAAHRAEALPTTDADGGRVMQVAEIDAPGGRARLVNLHLSFLDDTKGDRLRDAQWDRVAALLDDMAMATLIAGDFNATPGSALMRRLRADTRLDFGPGDLALSPATSLDGFGTGTNGRVIDHVIAVRPHFALTRRDVALAAVEPALGTPLSDHAAVVAEVALA
ncbi:MAG: endonuclease/exonuclease/phosphatase family protein [Hyphomicrobiaceae bacterium]